MSGKKILKWCVEKLTVGEWAKGIQGSWMYSCLRSANLKLFQNTKVKEAGGGIHTHTTSGVELGHRKPDRSGLGATGAVLTKTVLLKMECVSGPSLAWAHGGGNGRTQASVCCWLSSFSLGKYFCSHVTRVIRAHLISRAQGRPVSLGGESLSAQQTAGLVHGTVARPPCSAPSAPMKTLVEEVIAETTPMLPKFPTRGGAFQVSTIVMFRAPLPRSL